MKLRAMVVDDEVLAVERMEALLGQVGEVEVVAAVTNGGDAIDILKRGEVDLLFLDVEMPRIDGFDLIERLVREGVPLPCVILVTAHQIHAPLAFDAGVLDFLTKPVRLSRLEMAVSRAIRFRGDANAVARLAALGEAMRSERPVQDAGDLWVQRRGEAVRIDLGRVERVQAEGEYVRLMVDGTNYLHRAALSAILARLDEARFIRVHRSCVVQRNSIKAVRRQVTGSYQVVLTDGSVLPVGRTYRRLVRALVTGGDVEVG
jgi:two-component system response regulator AlgR